MHRDEFLETDVEYPHGTLSAATCDLAANLGPIAVTPLTTLAAWQARYMIDRGAPMKAPVDLANAEIARRFGVDNILTTLPADPTQTSTVEGTTRAARNYGLVLAGISYLANQLGAPSFLVTIAVMDDIRLNGALDGLDEVGGPVFIYTDDPIPLTGNEFTTDLQAAINAFIALPKNRSGVDDLQIETSPVETDVNAAGRVFVSSTVLPAWVSGQARSFALAVQGGTPDYTWSRVSGSLPTGLGLSSAGVISGTTTLAPGTTMSISPPVTVRVADSSTPQQSYEFEIRITIVAEAPVISMQPCPGEQYRTLNCQIANAAGGFTPYAYVLGTGGGFPPLGVSLGGNGTVSGVPSVQGTYIFQVCVVDLIGSQDCGQATITIAPTVPDPVAATWVGTYQYTDPAGAGNCGYSSSGSLSVVITQDETDISGSASITGFELKNVPSCTFAGFASSMGTISGAVQGSRLLGTFNFPIAETGGSWTPQFDAQVSGTTMSGTLTGGGSGTFSLTKQ